MAKPVVCVYHSADLDGKCSAAIVRRHHGDVELVPYDYGERINMERLWGRDIVMVDVCLEPFHSSMMAAIRESSSFVWIDHHESAIKKYEYEKSVRTDGLLDKVVAVLDKSEKGLAACELAWKYFHSYLPMPEAVRLLGRYDVWDHKDPNVRAFQYGMRSMKDTSPMSLLFDDLFSSGASCFHYILERGKAVLEYQEELNASIVRTSAFPTTFDGHKAIACNVSKSSSMVFDSVPDCAQYELMIGFRFLNNGMWRVDLFSHKGGPNVGAIASKYGGGGRQNAAGFECSWLPISSPQSQLQPLEGFPDPCRLEGAGCCPAFLSCSALPKEAAGSIL